MFIKRNKKGGVGVIRKLDEVNSELNNLIGYIEMSELQYLKLDNGKHWVDEALNAVDKIEEVRDFLNDLRMEL